MLRRMERGESGVDVRAVESFIRNDPAPSPSTRLVRSKSMDAISPLTPIFNSASLSNDKSSRRKTVFVESNSTHESSFKRIHSIDVDDQGNLSYGFEVPSEVTESILLRSKALFPSKDTSPQSTVTIKETGSLSIDGEGNVKPRPKRPTRKALPKARGRGNTFLMKQLEYLDTRNAMPSEMKGITSSSLIEYAFVAGPNVESLQNAFSSNSKSRDFRFINSTTMHCLVDPELLHLEGTNIGSDLETEALPFFCFPMGIEVLGHREGHTSDTAPGLKSRQRSERSLKVTRHFTAVNASEYNSYPSSSFVFTLQNHTTSHFGVCMVIPRSFQDLENEITIFTQYCVCLVTEYPYFSFLIDALKQFNRLGGFELDSPIEKLSDGIILHNQLNHFSLFASKLLKLQVPGMSRKLEISYVLNQSNLYLSMLRLHGPQKGVDPVVEKDTEISYHTMLWGLPTLLASMPLDQVHSFDCFPRFLHSL